MFSKLFIKKKKILANITGARSNYFFTLVHVCTNYSGADGVISYMLFLPQPKAGARLF